MIKTIGESFRGKYIIISGIPKYWIIETNEKI